MNEHAFLKCPKALSRSQKGQMATPGADYAGLWALAGP